MDEIDDHELDRALYLHEAGHAVVAFEAGMVVRSVRCDGQTNHVDAGLSEANRSAIDVVVADARAGKLTAEQFLLKGIAANRPQLTAWMGGMAGESLTKDARPLLSSRRGADDITMFFSYLNSVTRNLPPHSFQPVWLEAFIEAQDDAWNIVKKKEATVRAVAVALEPTGELSGDTLVDILRSRA